MKSKAEVKNKLGKFYTGKIAQTYDYARINDIRQKEALDREATIIRSFLNKTPKGKILDVACGTGIMFDNYKGREIYGVDISQDMLRIAQDKYPEAKLTKADAENLPFPDNYFSAAITSRFICHIPNYRKVISEISRVVRPGGTIIIDFFNKHSLALPATKMRLATGRLRHFNLFSHGDLLKIARSNNLEIREIRSKVFFPLKMFPRSLHSLSKKINDRLAENFPRLSSPMYVMFVKK
jgi:ubiquinone/menaquinone biosynthesis C-methylase UbiE